MALGQLLRHDLVVGEARGDMLGQTPHERSRGWAFKMIGDVTGPFPRIRKRDRMMRWLLDRPGCFPACLS
jgi:hypothetical protein